MLELFNTICESLKKNKDLVLIFLVQLFISNSAPWFNLKNLIKLPFIIVKKSWSFIKAARIQTKSILTQTSVAIKQSNEVLKEKAQFSSLLLIVGGFIILLKLHNAGIIKLNPNTVIAISAMILMMGLLSVISKMDFTKVDSVESDRNI